MPVSFQLPRSWHRVVHAILLAAFAAPGLTSLPLNAQDSEEPPFAVRFSAMSLGGSISGLHVDNGPESKKLFIPNASASRVEDYHGPAQVVFYTPEPGPEGMVIKKPAASVNLAAFNGGSALLLFNADPANPGRYRVLPVDDTPTGFPGNSWRVFNFTGFPLALKAASEEPQVIEPGQQRIFTGAGSSAPSESVQIAIHRNDNWQLVYNSIWSRRPQLRTLIFLVPAANNKSITVRKINQPLPTR